MSGTRTYTTRVGGKDTTTVTNRSVPFSEFCEDIVGTPRSPAPLTINSVSFDPAPVINGRLDRSTVSFGPDIATFVNYPVHSIQAAWVSDYLSLPSTTSEFTRLLAVTNPSRSEVSLPQFLAELKDLPAMLRHGARILSQLDEAGVELGVSFQKISRRTRQDEIARVRKIYGTYGLGDKFYRNGGRPITPGRVINDGLSVAQEAASMQIALQFGWIPMVSDIQKLLSLGASIEKRRSELVRLGSGKGLRRRVRLQERTGWATGTAEVISGPNINTSLAAPISVTKSARRWGTVRWKPSLQSIRDAPISDAQIWRVLTGVTVSSLPSLLWELLPWSWLIDYFSNVGSFLQSVQNEFDAVPHDACIMTHLRNDVFFKPAWWSWSSGARHLGSVAVSGGKVTHERKLRDLRPSGSPIVMKGSFLNLSQASILTSIGMTRGSRHTLSGVTSRGS